MAGRPMSIGCLLRFIKQRVADNCSIVIEPADVRVAYLHQVRRLRPAITRRIGIIRLAERSLMPVSQAFLDIFQPKFLAATRGRH